jgi:hypothetical protein
MHLIDLSSGSGHGVSDGAGWPEDKTPTIRAHGSWNGEMTYGGMDVYTSVDRRFNGC